jgi:acetyl esterase
MPLDPKVKTYLEQLAKANVPPVERLSPAEAREQMINASAFLGKPAAVHSTRDCTMPGGGAEIALRIYRPAERRGGSAIVYFHGGGWVVGSVDTHDGYCRALANAAGSVVVSVDYRLAPEHKFPAAADDAYAAACWVAEQATELGIDPQRIFVAGDSAGGNLAAVAALMARDRGGPPLAGQVLIYPITGCDFETPSYRQYADGYALSRENMRWFWRQYLSHEREAHSPYVSPLMAESLRDLCPALVIVAECDPLCSEGELYAQRLQESGVPVALSRYDGMIHGFARRLQLFPQAGQSLTQIAVWLQQRRGE